MRNANFPLLGTIEAIQEVCVPAARRMKPWQRESSRKIITDVLHDMDFATKSKVVIFLGLIELFCWLRFGRPFRSHDLNVRQKILNGLFNSRVKPLRMGFWGVNTLCKMGVYGQEFLYLEIGYELKRILQ